MNDPRKYWQQCEIFGVGVGGKVVRVFKRRLETGLSVFEGVMGGIFKRRRNKTA